MRSIPKTGSRFIVLISGLCFFSYPTYVHAHGIEKVFHLYLFLFLLPLFVGTVAGCSLLFQIGGRTFRNKSWGSRVFLISLVTITLGVPFFASLYGMFQTPELIILILSHWFVPLLTIGIAWGIAKKGNPISARKPTQRPKTRR